MWAVLADWEEMALVFFFPCTFQRLWWRNVSLKELKVLIQLIPIVGPGPWIGVSLAAKHQEAQGRMWLIPDKGPGALNCGPTAKHQQYPCRLAFPAYPCNSDSESSHTLHLDICGIWNRACTTWDIFFPFWDYTSTPDVMGNTLSKVNKTGIYHLNMCVKHN